MAGERNGQSERPGAARTAFIAMAPVLSLLLGGCGSSMLSGSSLNIFDSKKVTTTSSASNGPGDTVTDSANIECPGVAVRTGAATLMIGDKSASGEPGALDLRYQGTIIRTARECHLNAGVMTMKVGVEGRIITGPAGGPGAVDVPLRMAVVQEGVEPKTIVSKFASIPVTVANAVDRVTFTHVEPDITFPMPVPAGNLDNYVVYVGFDPLAAQQKKKPVIKRKLRAKPKPKQG